MFFISCDDSLYLVYETKKIIPACFKHTAQLQCGDKSADTPPRCTNLHAFCIFNRALFIYTERSTPPRLASTYNLYSTSVHHIRRNVPTHSVHTATTTYRLNDKIACATIYTYPDAGKKLLIFYHNVVEFILFTICIIGQV